MGVISDSLLKLVATARENPIQSSGKRARKSTIFLSPAGQLYVTADADFHTVAFFSQTYYQWSPWGSIALII